MTPTIVNADADPDPTTQMAWPNARHNTKGASESAAPDLAEYDGGEGDGGERSSSSRRTDGAGGKKRMSMMDLFNLSISMGGAQIAWTVELGYAYYDAILIIRVDIPATSRSTRHYLARRTRA